MLEERVRFENTDDVGLPDLSLAFVDRVLAYDHEAERLWVFGLGFGDARSSDGTGPRETAVARSRHVADDVAARVEWILSEGPTPSRPGRPSPPAELEIRSTVDASGYVKAVDTVLQEIASGNVYQANFSQRLSVDAPSAPPTRQATMTQNSAANPATAGLPPPQHRTLHHH